MRLGRTRDPLGERVRLNNEAHEVLASCLGTLANGERPVGRQASRVAETGEAVNPFSRLHRPRFVQAKKQESPQLACTEDIFSSISGLRYRPNSLEPPLQPVQKMLSNRNIILFHEFVQAKKQESPRLTCTEDIFSSISRLRYRPNSLEPPLQPVPPGTFIGCSGNRGLSA